MNTINLGDRVSIYTLAGPITGCVTVVDDGGLTGRLAPDDPTQVTGTIAVHASSCRPASTSAEASTTLNAAADYEQRLAEDAELEARSRTSTAESSAAALLADYDAATPTPRTTTAPGSITGSVAEMIAAVADAAVALSPAPFVVQYDEGEWIVAVTDQDDPRACIYTDAQSRRDRATIEAIAWLPTWARQSSHEHQQRAVEPLTYAQERGRDGLWMVTIDPDVAASLQWLYPHWSYAASNADEAAQLLWQHLGCPRAAGLVVVPASGEAIWYDVEDWTIAPGAPYWEHVHAFPARTRAGSASQLPGGSDPLVTAIHVSRTAGERAASRTRAAKAAIAQYVLDETYDESDRMHPHVAAWVADGGDDPLDGSHWWIGIPGAVVFDEASAARIIAAIAAMELHGVGGPGGIDGGATVVMSWRSALGKGRRQASDGQAWDAAITALSASIGVTDVMLALPFVRPHDLQWPMALALSRAYESRAWPELATAWCDVARAVMARAQEPGSPLDGPAVRLGQRYGL